jgi:hypothetical protein
MIIFNARSIVATLESGSPLTGMVGYLHYMLS